jgi:hypothetical protein
MQGQKIANGAVIEENFRWFSGGSDFECHANRFSRSWGLYVCEADVAPEYEGDPGNDLSHLN